MNEKYELTEETKQIYGITLHRIRAKKDFGYIKAGEVGGWIEKEDNLCIDGNAWVYGDARVYGDAEVYGDARVCEDAEVYGDARVCEDAEVYGDARVYGNAWVCGDAEVYGDARVYGNAWVYGNARVYGDAWVYGDARVYGDAWVYGDADILWISKIGSRLGTTTVFRNKDKNLTITCGCFLGTLEEFSKKVEQTHGDSKHGREYKALIELIKIHFDIVTEDI